MDKNTKKADKFWQNKAKREGWEYTGRVDNNKNRKEE